MSEKYSAEVVSQHNHANDLWIVLHGKVYDVTKFLKEHPGGEEVLLNLAGQDGTKCFDEVGHTQEAIQLKDGLQIGELTGSLSAPAGSGNEATIDDDEWTYEEQKQESTPYVPIFIGLAVLVYAILFYYIFY